MNRDDMKLTFAQLRLLHPPLPRFQTNQLAELFAKLCKSHDFESFEARGDSEAEFGTEGVRTVHLMRDRVHLDEQVRVSFDLLRREFRDISETMKDELGIQAYFAPNTRLRMLWPLPPNADGDDNDAGDILRTKVIQLNEDQYKLLGASSIENISLTIDTEGEGDLHRSIELGPYSRDPSQLFIELETMRHDLVETPSVLEQYLESDYNYLRKEVASFVQTFMP